MNKEIRFGKMYKKLRREKFCTIRDKIKGEVGDLFTISTPMWSAMATLTEVEEIRLKDIPAPFLLDDTDTDDYDEAMEAIKEFYPEVMGSSIVYIHHLTYI